MTTTTHDIAATILYARPAVQNAVYRTPLELSLWLSDLSGATVFLKMECFQPTGSFKVRGAAAAMSMLNAEGRARGVVTASAGNHGLGVAHIARQLGVEATVVVPEAASPAKVAALERYPISLVRGGPNYDTAEREARRISHQTGAIFVSPYNDVHVIAGQGTVGVELLEDLPDVDLVLVPVGGGGLISGIGSWVKTLRPRARVIGVQAAASPAMHDALRAGRLVEIPVLPTLADGLAANIEQESLTFDLARQVVDGMVLVSEDEIGAAVADAFRELHIPMEGSSAVSVAALRAGRVPDIAGQKVAVVITGRNIAASTVATLLQKYPPE